MSRRFTNHAGFTLIETIVVVSILVLVSGSLLGIIRSFYRSNAYVFEAASSVDSARRGLATALHSVREASYADDGAYPISAAATSSISFYSDVDRDGGIEKVRIYVIGETLYQTVINAAGSPPSYTGQSTSTTTIATYLRNTAATPLFTYYDASGVQLATTSPALSAIASIRSIVMVDLNPNRAPNVLTLTGSATLRNLRDQ